MNTRAPPLWRKLHVSFKLWLESWRLTYYARYLARHPELLEDMRLAERRQKWKENFVAPRMTSNLSESSALDIVPDGEYKTVPSKIEERTSKLNDDGTGGNPMIVTTWRAVGGEYNDRVVAIENLMVGGSTKDGRPMPTFKLLNVIESLGAPWSCAICHPDEDNAVLESRPFKKVRAEGSIHNYCPEGNHKIGNITFDYSYWEGRQCITRVGHEKMLNSDRERNFVRSHRPTD